MKRLLVLLVLVLLSVSQAQFQDVPPGHWAENAVEDLVDLGIITGFPDGTFAGDAGVTRYQLTVALARFWATASTKPFEDLWTQVIGVQTSLEDALDQQELLLANLDGALSRLERLEAASARAEGVVETLADVQGLATEASNEAVFAAQDVKALREELVQQVSALRDSVGKLRAEVEATPVFDPEQNRLMVEGLEIQRDAIAELQVRLNDLAASQDEALGEATKQMRELGDTVAAALAVRESAWQGVLAVSAGFRGRAASGRLEAALDTPLVGGRLSLDERALELTVEGNLSPAFGVTARYFAGPLGNTGLVGPVLRLSPALRVAALGGSADGLALGGYVEHDGDGADAVVPGLDVFFGGFLMEDGFGRLNRLNVVGSARYALPLGGSLALAPRVTYRRVGSVYQVIVPELGVSAPLGDALLSGALRVGLVQDLAGGPGRTIPEGEVSVAFPSGLFVSAEVNGQLPRLYGLGSLSEPNPLAVDYLTVGLRLGYRLDLDALW